MCADEAHDEPVNASENHLGFSKIVEQYQHLVHHKIEVYVFFDINSVLY